MDDEKEMFEEILSMKPIELIPTQWWTECGNYSIESIHVPTTDDNKCFHSYHWGPVDSTGYRKNTLLTSGMFVSRDEAIEAVLAHMEQCK